MPRPLVRAPRPSAPAATCPRCTRARSLAPHTAGTSRGRPGWSTPPAQIQGPAPSPARRGGCGGVGGRGHFDCQLPKNQHAQLPLRNLADRPKARGRRDARMPALPGPCSHLHGAARVELPIRNEQRPGRQQRQRVRRVPNLQHACAGAKAVTAPAGEGEGQRATTTSSMHTHL